MKSQRLLLSLFVLIFTTLTIFAQSDNIVSHYKFDKVENNALVESVSGYKAEVHGFHELISGVNDKGLLLDGYTSYIENETNIDLKLQNGFSVGAWIAFQAYPWNWVAIVDKQKSETNGFNLSVDANGFLRFQVVVDGKLQTVKSSNRMNLLVWNHIAGTFDPNDGLKIFINGKDAGALKISGSFTPAEDVNLWIGRSHKKLPPAYPIRLDLPASYSFDGVIDEVKIYNTVLNSEEISEIYLSSKPENDYALEFRKMPAGPDGPGRFGAYYTHLKFSDTWDYPWRVGPYSDVVVRFDEAGYKFVFWRGTSYIPCWVTENGIWYTNEFNETWGDDVLGCAEPMSDKQTKHSNVRIIESNDARVKVHWRYALVDNRGVIAKTDSITGWGDWSDEYYTIYPDGIGLRKIHLWSSAPTKPHQFQEAIILNPPGTHPEDNINVDAITMMNMKGETHTYSWADGAPESIDQPENFNMQFINLKSKAIPFIIVNERKPSVTRRQNIDPDGPWLRPYSGEIIKEHSIFPWWNHWPVAQIPSDGRWASEPDRVSHTSLSNDLEWGELELTDRTHVRVMMHGLIDKPKEEIVALAKSWLYPPEMEIESDGFLNDGYSEEERAFMISKSGNDNTAFYATISADKESPLYNPAIIIENWDDVEAELELNGKKIMRGKNFRVGLRHTLDGSDLIVWLNYKSDEPTTVKLIPVKK